jgi:hypothetical protein
MTRANGALRLIQTALVPRSESPPIGRLLIQGRLDRIDKASLAQQRRVTIPLLHELEEVDHGESGAA